MVACLLCINSESDLEFPCCRTGCHKTCMNTTICNLITHGRALRMFPMQGPFLVSGQTTVYGDCPTCFSKLKMLLLLDPIRIFKIQLLHRGSRQLGKFLTKIGFTDKVRKWIAWLWLKFDNE